MNRGFFLLRSLSGEYSLIEVITIQMVQVFTLETTPNSNTIMFVMFIMIFALGQLLVV